MTRSQEFLTLMGYMVICTGIILLANLLALVWVLGTLHWGARILALLR